MSKSFNAFKRGLSYHAGAGIGEAVHYATRRIDEMKMHKDINNHLRKK